MPKWSFTSGRSGFRYADDAFRFTDAPGAADGRWEDGALRLDLGRVNGQSSGGWSKGFTLEERSEATLSFRYAIWMSPDNRSRDVTDLMVSIDGEQVGARIARLTGDGPGGATKTGWRTVEIDLGSLAPGRHEITIGGFANSRSDRDDRSVVRIDDVDLSWRAPAADLDPFEAEVLRLTNAYRERNGRDPLRADPELTASAEDWSRQMGRGDFFRHSDTAEQIEKFGYDAVGWGENIAAGYPTPKAVVDGWIDSPGHRRNLLRADFEDIGIGYHRQANDGGDAPYTHYWTQIFGVADEIA